MTVGDLREALAKLEAGQEITILVNGPFTPAVEVVVPAGAHFAMLRGKNTLPLKSKFTINEQGLVGHLVRLGLGNEEMARILGRSLKELERARKVLGF